MAYYLGLDPSLTAFAAVGLDGDQHTPALIATKPKDWPCFQARLDWIQRELVRLLSVRRPALVAIEGFSYGSARSGLTQVQISAVGSVARLVLWQQSLPFLEVPPSTLKKWIASKGNVEKNLMIREVFKRWGYNAVDDNDADAYALARLAQAVGNGFDTRGLKSEALRWRQIVDAITRTDARPIVTLS